MIGIIAALSPEGVIGRENRIPWHYPADLRRFKTLTWGATIIMGRHTFESIGRPLPGRTNIVVTQSQNLGAVRTAPSLDTALKDSRGPVWIIGGARLYEDALTHAAHFVDLTYVPNHVPVKGSVLFPPMNPEDWAAGPFQQNRESPELWHQRFARVSSRT